MDTKTDAGLWWLFLIQGIVTLILGLLLILAPGATVTLLIQFLGIYWLVVGMLGIVNIFIGKKKHRIWGLISGIIAIIAGIAVLNHPLTSAVLIPVTLIYILAIAGIVEGILGFIRTFKGEGIGYSVMGIIYIIFGAILFSHTAIAIALLVFVVAITALFGGGSLIAFSLQVRKDK